MMPRLIAILTLVAGTSQSIGAHADDGTQHGHVNTLTRGGGSRLHWDPAWPRFALGEAITTGVAIGTSLTMTLIGPRQSTRRGGIGPDEAVRDALRLDNLEDRRTARDASDVLLTTMVAYPVLVDAGAVAGWRVPRRPALPLGHRRLSRGPRLQKMCSTATPGMWPIALPRTFVGGEV